jgi:hypothetical protein
VRRVAARYAQLKPGDVRGLLELADFCRDHGMPARERELLERVIEHAPDHAQGRARLGYVRTSAEASNARADDAERSAEASSHVVLVQPYPRYVAWGEAPAHEHICPAGFVRIHRHCKRITTEHGAPRFPIVGAKDPVHSVRGR